MAGWISTGLSSAGVDVTDFGLAPTPALAAVTRSGSFDAGVMITASHNPPEYNGIKVFDSEGIGLARSVEEQVERLMESGDFASGTGKLEAGTSILKRYMGTIPDALVSAAVSKGIGVLLDPGNGAASGFARTLFQRLGLNTAVVNDSPDGHFPGRGAEPSAAALQGIAAAMRTSGANLAACFDGDADRVVFCDTEGFIGLDEVVAFIAYHRAMDTSRLVLATTIETGMLPQYAMDKVGGQTIRGRVGDVAVAHLAREHDAALGAETVGVYIFPEQGLYPDSMVAVLHLLAMLSHPSDIRRFIETLPRLHLEKRKVQCPTELRTQVMSIVHENLRDSLDIPTDVIVNLTDGLRLEWPEAWILVRPSGTEPVIRVTTEATDPVTAQRLALAADAVVSRLVLEAS